MREYPKIETLFERDDKFVVTDVLKRPVFRSINPWVVTEKVDGTNIRISYKRGDAVVKIGGRTDNAQIHQDVYRHILENYTPPKMDTLFREYSEPDTIITLFGEGYGAGIQKGAYYRPDKAVILFDMLIECGDGHYWQGDDAVTEAAGKLGVDRVPILGRWSLDEIVERVRAGVVSTVAQTAGIVSEGIVARPEEPLFDRRGNRLILKLKTRDFGRS